MSVDALVRDHIRNLNPYEPVLPFEVISQELGIPIENIVKLDANENPYGPLPAAREALATLQFPHIYPDSQSQILAAAIAERIAVPPAHILPGAGADELIDLTMRLFINPGDGVLTCPPTFGMYAFDTSIHAGHFIEVHRKADFALDVAAVEQAVSRWKPKLLFIASPNNPDGGLMSRQEFERLAALPVVLVVDEAYVEFAGDDVSVIRDVPHRKNVIVLRTFSKWAGLAGLRVGYGVFPESLLPHLRKIKQPYMVSAAANAAALASLEHAGELDAIGQKLILERTRLLQGLEAIRYLEPYPSRANFILCQVTGRDAARLKAALRKQGILIRYFRTRGLEDHIRISVGRPEDTRAVLAALREWE